jgi:SAM-dependent methyltransferase
MPCMRCGSRKCWKNKRTSIKSRNEKLINCKICGSEALQKIASLPLETADKIITSEITKCLVCGTFSSALDYSDSEVQSHFELASYTDVKFEKHYLESKRPLFQAILQQIKSLIYLSPNKATCLDIGSSYGHMLDLFKSNGITVQGVEIVDRLREDLKKRGYQIYKSISEVPEENVYDIITFIDSFIYLEDPVKTLTELRPHLRDNGILVIRIPNRTPFLNMARLLRMPIKTSLFLDSKHNFSLKGMRIIFEKTGFKLMKVVAKEKGKKPIVDVKGEKMPFSKIIYGHISNILCSVLGTRISAILSPGLLFFCKPDPSWPGK